MPTEAEAEFGDGYNGVSLRVPRDRIVSLLQALECDADPLRFAERYWGMSDLPGAGQFRTAFLNCIRQCEEGGQTLIARPNFRAAHSELLGLHLANIIALTSTTERTGTAPRTSALRRCLDYIEEHQRDTISLAAMAADAAISLRTLQTLFARELGTTVTAYIRGVRLDSVHARLAVADAQDTVARVALEEGFNHLGEFGQMYRTRFGERPSDTLRGARRPG